MLKATILGCGSSGGVPRIGNDWGACDPTNPRNRRSRCSLLLEACESTVLIDTSPDMREQLLRSRVDMVDAVFFTHAHADQAHGIDDLRVFFLRARHRIPVYADAETMRTLTFRFNYCFESVLSYPAILDGRVLHGEAVEIAPGFSLLPITVTHGEIDALGFRAGGLAYIPDVSDIPPAAMEKLGGLDVLIVDALRYRPHPSHAHVERALEWIGTLKPKRAILTNMHVDLDFETLRSELPESVEPAFDGMTVTV